MAPQSAKLSQGGAGITACCLHHDSSRTFALQPLRELHPYLENKGAAVLCVVCRSARMEVYSLPDLDLLLSINDISDGPMVAPSSSPQGELSIFL